MNDSSLPLHLQTCLWDSFLDAQSFVVVNGNRKRRLGRWWSINDKGSSFWFKTGFLDNKSWMSQQSYLGCLSVHINELFMFHPIHPSILRPHLHYSVVSIKSFKPKLSSCFKSENWKIRDCPSTNTNFLAELNAMQRFIGLLENKRTHKRSLWRVNNKGIFNVVWQQQHQQSN